MKDNSLNIPEAVSKQDKPQLFRSPIQEQKRLVSEFRQLFKVHPLHWHGFVEVEIVCDGTGEQIFNGKNTFLERGTVSVMRLVDYHKITPAENLSIINISFDENLLPMYILEKLWSSSGICKKVNGVTFEAIEGIATLLVHESTHNPEDLTVAKKLLECLFIKLLNVHKSASSDDSTPIKLCLQYIQTHFKQNPTIAQISKDLHYNPKYFCKIFRNEVGVTYVEYLTRLKINYAKNLLLTTDLNIDYISFESGFGSPANFRRSFKEACGVSPAQFRKPKKQQN